GGRSVDHHVAVVRRLWVRCRRLALDGDRDDATGNASHQLGELQVRRAAVLAAAFAASFALAASGFAASTTSAPAALTAEQIVEKHVAARGGLKKIRAIQTLRESGRVTEGPNREALVTRELKRPASSRFEITLQGITGIF